MPHNLKKQPTPKVTASLPGGQTFHTPEWRGTNIFHPRGSNIFTHRKRGNKQFYTHKQGWDKHFYTQKGAKIYTGMGGGQTFFILGCAEMSQGAEVLSIKGPSPRAEGAGPVGFGR